MARPRKEYSIEEEIKKQEEAVARSKARYDSDVKKLKDLYAKKDEMCKKKLLEAVEKSGKSYEEIMAFLQEKMKETEWRTIKTNLREKFRKLR